MKNYKNFLLERITKNDLININDIVKVQVVKNGEIQKMFYNGVMTDEIILSDKNLVDFDSLNIETLPYTRANTFVIIYCYYNNEPKILKLTLSSFKKFAKKLDISEKNRNGVRGQRIEAYQNLGLLYNKREKTGDLIIPNEGYIFKMSDFNFEIFGEEYVGVDFDENDNLIYDSNDFNLLFGSIKFKNFMEHRHIYNKHRHEFHFNKVIHKEKQNFLKALLKKEEYIVGEFNLELNEDKVNTTDIFVSDDKNILKKINDEKYFVLSEISNSILINSEFEKANSNEKKIPVYEGGVCYLFDKNILEIEDLKGSKDKENWIRKIIDKYGKNSSKFIQISLKKSKTGAQFGKVTKTILNQFSIDDDEDDKKYENVGNFFNGIVKKFKNIFNKIKKYFSKLNIEKDNIIEKDTKFIVDNFVNKLNNKILFENNINYIPKTIETKIIGDLFIYNDEPEKVDKISNLEYKKYASGKIDDFMINLEKTALNIEPKKLHEKFAEILTVSLMGSTNLPLYMVFGTTNANDISFTLHTYRTDKKQKHIDKAIKKSNEQPMYIAYIRNYVKDDELVYKTLNILIYNYSSITDRYISVDMRTNSSSHKSFIAETKTPSDKLVKKLKEEYYKIK